MTFAPGNTVWVHLGIGNISAFLGGIADRLLRENLTDRGITCVKPSTMKSGSDLSAFDNLALAVTLYKDGSQRRVWVPSPKLWPSAPGTRGKGPAYTDLH